MKRAAAFLRQLAGGWAVMLTLCATAVAQTNAAPMPAASAPTSTASAAAPTSPERLAQDRLSSDLAASAARFNSLEKAVAKSTESSEVSSQRSFWLALAAVAVTALNQFALFWHQRALRREQASDEVSNAYADWQMKQLTELYGPMRALLGQSNAMYRQMNKALAHERSSQFRLEKRVGGDFDDFVFQIHANGEWTQFRTVRDLGAVYNKGLKVEPCFDAVVAVGERMAKLIEEKAGYARPDDTELVRVMGVYLAHYAVLSRLHSAARKGEDIQPTVGDQQATFPLEIQKLVNDGFDAINAEVMRWRNRAQA